MGGEGRNWRISVISSGLQLVPWDRQAAVGYSDYSKVISVGATGGLASISQTVGGHVCKSTAQVPVLNPRLLHHNGQQVYQ